MIISFAAGRLGNQLFEYAYLNSIRRKNEFLVLSGFDELYKIFDIQPYNIRFFINTKLKEWIHRKFWRFCIKCRNHKIINYIKEDTSTETIQSGKGLFPFKFVEGYFQNDYSINENFLNLIKFKKEFAFAGDKIIDEFPKDKKLCFIHVRHGDYDENIKLPQNYYKKALQEFNLENTFFYITGDDFNWEKDFFKFLPYKTVSNNSMAIDLYIMSKCSEAIISNSSFAYWGALLGIHKKKIVAPKYWLGYKIKKWQPTSNIETQRFLYIE